MKTDSFFLSILLCTLLAFAASAQQIPHPATGMSAGWTFDYYGLEPAPQAETSPSDVKEKAAASSRDAVPPCEAAPTCDAPNSCDSGTGCENAGGCCSCYLFGPDEAWELFPKNECTGLKIGGWFEMGYHSENEPLSFVRGDRLSFLDVPDGFLLNQAWIYFEKKAQGDCCCWDWGYRVDVLYGTNGHAAQSYGNPRGGIPNFGAWDASLDHGIYEWAIPQMYVELNRGDLTIIGGHFFTPVGYEVIPATGNFFYSHTLTHFNSEPFTHTGVLARYAVNEDVEVFGGWVLGWDTGFAQFGNAHTFIGGISMPICDHIRFIYGATAGDFGARGDQAYSHHMSLDMTLTDKLQYILYSDFVTIGAGNPGGTAAGVLNDQVSVANYLFYTVNDCVKVGGRIEWWKSDAISYYAITGGVNIQPHANLTIRPEIRYDWTPTSDPAAPGRLYAAGVNNVTTFGIDAIFTF